MNLKKAILEHIIIELLKTKDKESILKIARGKNKYTDFLSEMIQAGMQQNDIFKYWNKEKAVNLSFYTQWKYLSILKSE